jgi:hypothetical protein
MIGAGCCAPSGPESGSRRREAGGPLRRPAQAAAGAGLPPLAALAAAPGQPGRASAVPGPRGAAAEHKAVKGRARRWHALSDKEAPYPTLALAGPLLGLPSLRSGRLDRTAFCQLGPGSLVGDTRRCASDEKRPPPALVLERCGLLCAGWRRPGGRWVGTRCRRAPREGNNPRKANGKTVPLHGTPHVAVPIGRHIDVRNTARGRA